METQTDWSELVALAKTIVSDADAMTRKHTNEVSLRVSYCCVFSRDQADQKKWDSAASATGVLAKETPTGSVYVVPEIPTDAGPLRVLKIRRPDPTRTERGDADFRIDSFDRFKESNLGRPGFSLIERPDFEMIELVDSAVDARAYFSHPPVEQHDGIRQALAADS